MRKKGFCGFNCQCSSRGRSLEAMLEEPQHAGREPWFRAKNRVTFLHDRISLGKIGIPELHDIIPSAFEKHKGIRVKFKELGYEVS